MPGGPQQASGIDYYLVFEIFEIRWVVFELQLVKVGANFKIHNKFDILLYIFRREMSFVASSKKLFCSDSDSLSFSKIHNDEKIIFAIFISDF